MTDREKKLNEIQDTASSTWIDNNGVGTLLIATGVGKTLTFVRCLYKAVDKGLLKLGDTIRFWAETTARQSTLFVDEREASIKYLGKDFISDFNIIFRCYQSGIDNTRVDMECYDEIDFAISEVHSKCIIDSNCTLKLGLTATNNEVSTIHRGKVDATMMNKVRQSDSLTQKGIITNLINKGQLLDVILPVIYEYSIPEAINDGVLSNFKTYVVNHKLNNVKSYILPFKKSKVEQTEQAVYSIYDMMCKDYSKPRVVLETMIRKRTALLYNLKSKVPVVKKLIQNIGSDKKIILFGVHKDILYQITPNVVEKDNIDELLDKFNKGEINVIASSKMLGRGKTLKGLEYCILVSYYSTSTSFLQWLGRIVRYAEGKVAKLIVLRTLNTQEMVWFEKFNKVLDDRGNLKYELDLKITKQIDSDQLLKR